MLLQSLAIDVLEVVRSFLLIGGSRFHHLIIDHQNTVSHCHGGPFTAPSFPEASVLLSKTRCESALSRGQLAPAHFSDSDCLGGCVRCDVSLHSHRVQGTCPPTRPDARHPQSGSYLDRPPQTAHAESADRLP